MLHDNIKNTKINNNMSTFITLFKSINCYVGRTILRKIFFTLSMNDGILCKISSVPQNIVMNMNNVMSDGALKTNIICNA